MIAAKMLAAATLRVESQQSITLLAFGGFEILVGPNRNAHPFYMPYMVLCGVLQSLCTPTIHYDQV